MALYVCSVHLFCLFCFCIKKNCRNDQAYNCLIHFYSELIWKTTFDGSRPLMEDTLWWKRTFNRRRPLTGADLWWKRNFDGRRPSMEDFEIPLCHIPPLRSIFEIWVWFLASDHNFYKFQNYFLQHKVSQHSFINFQGGGSWSPPPHGFS